MNRTRLLLLLSMMAVAGFAQTRFTPSAPVGDAGFLRYGTVEAIGNAKAVEAPRRQIGQNEWYVGYYTGNTLDYSTGLGQGGSYSAGILLPPSLFSDYAGCKVVGIRFAMGGDVNKYQGNGSRVFIQEVANNYYSDDVTTQDIDVVAQGWNEVRLKENRQYTLPSDGTTSLIVGFDFEQHGTDMPLVFCQGGMTGYNLVFIPSGQNRGWQNIGTSTTDSKGNTVYLGNLAIQLIVEKVKPLQDLSFSKVATDKTLYKAGDAMKCGFVLKNTGAEKVDGYNVDMTVGGMKIANYSTVESLSVDAYDTVYVDANVPEDLAVGSHKLEYAVTSIGGNKLADDSQITDEAVFCTYSVTVPRQQTLVEHHTSSTCTWCPRGAENLKKVADMRGDLAWVAIYGNLYSADPNNTEQCDSIESYERLLSFPGAAYNRVYIPRTGPNSYSLSLSLNPASTDVTATLNQYIDVANSMSPCFSMLSVTPVVDKSAKTFSIAVDANGVEKCSEILSNYGLYVYLTEDGLHGSQTNAGVTDKDFEWNHVFRLALGKGVCGNDISWNGDTFSEVFAGKLKDGWNPDKMHVIAFVAPKVEYGLTGIEYMAADNCLSVPLVPGSDAIGSVLANASRSIVGYYTLSGQHVDNPADGIYIIRYADGTAKKCVFGRP